MSESLKVVLALLFVTVLGWVLLQPVLDAVDEAPIGDTGRPSSSPTADDSRRASSPSPDDREQDAGLPDTFRTQTLSAAYPRRCLRGVEATSDVVAVDRGNVVAAGPVGGSLSDYDGTRLFGVGVAGGIAWRAGERGVYVGAPGSRNIRAFPAGRVVLWSPIADCALVVTDGGALLALPGELPLVEDNVGSVAFSPDGRRLAVVLKEEEAASVWVASLSTARLREVLRELPTTRVDLEGWSPDARTIYLSVGAGDVLSFVTPLRTSAPSLTGRITADPVEALEPCGDRLLGIFRGRIAEITTSGPELLGPAGARYRYLSCSPDGSFIAAIGDEGLVLLDQNAGLLRDLVDDTGYTDVFVDWGESGRGVIFGRVRSDASPTAAELWHIPEGGSARPTGITYRGGPRAVDWAASPPTGLP